MPDAAAAPGRTRAVCGRLGVARALKFASCACFGLGTLCAALYVLAQTDRHVAATTGVEEFHKAELIALADAPDQGLWSAQRQAGYRESLGAALGAPSALLSIPAVGVTVPVFVGTSELVLNRGAGWIEGTAQPGEDGNVGIAGHRDGYFRALKDLKIGDAIELRTLERTRSYRVAAIKIVDPADVAVLDPTEEPSLTLVTCYPFYYVGNAPRRYIVRGVLD